MKTTTKIAALSIIGVMALTGCSAVAATGDDEVDGTTTSESVESTTETTDDTTSEASDDAAASDETGAGQPPEGEMPAEGEMPEGGGPGMSTDPSSVSTEDEVIALINEAYGEASLGLHRGHQPVESTLIDTLGISHDEMHVRMEEQGQNLSDIAEELGVGTQTLIDALVDSWTPAIDNLVENGTITEDESDEYLAALEEAFTYRVTWDGEEATPTFDGI